MRNHLPILFSACRIYLGSVFEEIEVRAEDRRGDVVMEHDDVGVVQEVMRLHAWDMKRSYVKRGRVTVVGNIMRGR